MLVLSRKVGERILIGDNISITVVRITGNGVRIGVEAPDELVVVRQELKDEMEAREHDQRRAPEGRSCGHALPGQKPPVA